MFHNRAINFWDKLPDSVVLATNSSSFKRQLLNFMDSVGSENFLSFSFLCCFYYIVFTGTCKWKLHPPLVYGPMSLFLDK